MAAPPPRKRSVPDPAETAAAKPAFGARKPPPPRTPLATSGASTIAGPSVDRDLVRGVAREVANVAVSAVKADVGAIAAQLATMERRLEALEGADAAARVEVLEQQIATMVKLQQEALAASAARPGAPPPMPAAAPQAAAAAAPVVAPAAQPAVAPQVAAAAAAAGAPQGAAAGAPQVAAAAASLPQPGVAVAPQVAAPAAPVATQPAPLAYQLPRDIVVDLADLDDMPFIDGERRKRRVFIGVLVVLLGLVATFIVFAIVSQSNHRG